jgi:hypothetical protein
MEEEEDICMFLRLSHYNVHDVKKILSIYFGPFVTITVLCRLKNESLEKSQSYFVASFGILYSGFVSFSPPTQVSLTVQYAALRYTANRAVRFDGMRHH